MPKTENIYSRNWSVDNPKAVILLVHGLAEHTERYHAIGNYLTVNQYSVMAIDLPGHGRSGGVPGHIDQFSNYRTAIRQLHKTASQKYPNTPIFLLGHSMGGLISTQLLLDHQKLFQGALLSGAAIETPQEPPAWQTNIIKLISKIAPTLGLLKLDASGISRDPNVVKAYMNDPLVYKGKLSARFLVEMSSAMDDCKVRAKKIKLPIIIMHGGNDLITKPEGSSYLYEHISSTDKTLKIYDGLYHEIFNEPEAQNIYADIISWLDSHT